MKKNNVNKMNVNATTASKKAKKGSNKVITTCSACNKPFRYDPSEGTKTLCKECQAKEEAAWRAEHTYVCKDCGRKFFLTRSEVEFYTSHELKMPKRCKPCRNYRKVLRAKGELPPTVKVGEKKKPAQAVSA